MGTSLHIGSALREWTTGEFRFGCWTTREFGGRVREHQHNNAHIMFVCTGSYRSRVAGVSNARHRILFGPAYTVHRDRFESPGLFFTINFTRAPEDVWAGESPDAPTLADSVRARTLLQRLMRRGGSPPPQEIESLMAELMAEFRPERPPAREPVWMRKVIEALHGCTTTPRVAELAAIAGVHPYHLASVFRRFNNCTPAEYARNLRVNAALGALLRRHADMAEIAVEHGFADQSHFTRAVSAMFGVGPAELRRRLI